LTELVQLLKQDLTAQKKDMITKGIQSFTDEEAKRFWPIFDAYNSELGNFVEARVALIEAYVDDGDNMNDAKATDRLNRRINIQKQRDILDEK
jgi:hypothetical protein